MAHYEHLPIYKSAMELAVFMENTVRGFSRYNKFTIGTEMRNLARDIIGSIIAANSASNRRVHLLQLREQVERLKVNIRICQEVKGFNSFAGYTRAVELSVAVARQNEGWLKSCNKARMPEPSATRSAGEL